MQKREEEGEKCNEVEVSLELELTSFIVSMHVFGITIVTIKNGFLPIISLFSFLGGTMWYGV